MAKKILKIIYNYTIIFKNNQYYLKLLKFLFFFFTLSLFFPIRYVFLTNSAYLTGQYSDFTSFSLYLSDILLFTTSFFVILPHGKKFWLKIKDLFSGLRVTTFFIYWLILNLLWHHKSISGLNIYFFLKWLEFIIVAYGTAILFSNVIRYTISDFSRNLAYFFVSFSVIQSIIALLQFYKQKSIGIYILGESHLSVGTANVAKVVVDGITYIRGYGTFPHPNVLGAFLVSAILISLYLWLNSEKRARLLLILAILVNTLGLTVTFSRASYFVLGLGLLGLFGFLIFLTFSKNRISGNVNITPIIITVGLSAFFSFLIFRPFLLSRATLNDKAVFERKQFNSIAIQMIKSNPIFGVGIGESVLHMEQYNNYHLEPWEKQPIHNYFFLSASELGIPGALILIWIFLSSLKSIFYKLKTSTDFQQTTYYLLFTAILSSFLILMLFDHYFYTLQQTQIILWIILGIIVGLTRQQTAKPS